MDPDRLMTRCRFRRVRLQTILIQDTSSQDRCDAKTLMVMARSTLQAQQGTLSPKSDANGTSVITVHTLRAILSRM